MRKQSNGMFRQKRVTKQRDYVLGGNTVPVVKNR